MIRVLHSLQTMRSGGIATGVRNLILSLRPPEFQHAVVVEQACEQALDLGDAPVHVVQACPWWRAALRIAQLRRLLLDLRIDLVHGRDWPGADALCAGALNSGMALVFSNHGRPGAWPTSRPLRQRVVLQLLGLRLTRAFGVAPDLATELAGFLGWPQELVPVMVGGVDTDRYRPQLARSHASRHVFRVGMAGVLRPVKRPDLMLEMVRQLAGRTACRNFQVEVAGEGPLWGQVRDAVRRFGWEAMVSLPGRIADMPGWYRTLDAVIVPSDYEGCSNIILEAMASGLPVVATDVGLTRELLGDGIAGVIVRRGEAASVAGAVLSLIEDPESAARIGHAARERAVTLYSLAQTHLNFARVYREAVYAAGRQ